MVNTQLHTRDSILQILSVICDPEISVVSIQEMGILRDVVVHDNVCEIIITPTYTGCPAMGIIEADIQSTLHHAGMAEVKVTTVYTPAWTTDWMSESTKEKLQKFGIAAPVHSHCMDWSKPEQHAVICPLCHAEDTQIISNFGSTACKALYKCNVCKEPFDYFKCH
jgi:ring-1,2-phenylacetyl-CoA epoxidase subunit PaaD